MGIPELQAKHALHRTGNSSAEMAVQWYFENMDDPTIQGPLPTQKVGGAQEESGPQISQENIMMVCSMGFTEE